MKKMEKNVIFKMSFPEGETTEKNFVQKNGKTQQNFNIDQKHASFRNQNNSPFSMTKAFIHDSISDMLTRIRNACLVKKPNVRIPRTKLNDKIVEILQKEGFIQSYHFLLDSNDMLIRLKYRSKIVYNKKIKKSCITNLKRISTPGLRIYANSNKIPRILSGTGITILSTPKGILTDRDACLNGVGGELICSIW